MLMNQNQSQFAALAPEDQPPEDPASPTVQDPSTPVLNHSSSEKKSTTPSMSLSGGPNAPARGPSRGPSVEDLIESKRILAQNCAREIHRLTQTIKHLQLQLNLARQSSGSSNLLDRPGKDDRRPTISLPVRSRRGTRTRAPSRAGRRPNMGTNKFGSPRHKKKRITARGIRKVQSSMQFDGQDLVELFGEDRAPSKEEIRNQEHKVDIPANNKAQEDKNDVYQLEIEISGKRELDDHVTEYEVRKRISYSRWQTLADLKRDNLHDFVKIYDFKVAKAKSQQEKGFPPDPGQENALGFPTSAFDDDDADDWCSKSSESDWSNYDHSPEHTPLSLADQDFPAQPTDFVDFG